LHHKIGAGDKKNDVTEIAAYTKASPKHTSKRLIPVLSVQNYLTLIHSAHCNPEDMHPPRATEKNAHLS
jgi:hypothetical protein